MLNRKIHQDRSNILLRNTNNSYLDVSGIMTYISEAKGYDSSMAESCSNMLESALLEIHNYQRIPSLDEVNKIDSLMTHPIYFKYDFEPLEISCNGKRFNAEVVKAKFSYLHSDETIELYLNLRSDLFDYSPGYSYRSPYYNDLLDGYFNSDNNKAANNDFDFFEDITNFLRSPVLSRKGLKIVSGTEHKLHYHLFQGKRGKNQLYDSILTFDPKSNSESPLLYSVKHAEGKAQIKFRPGQFKDKTRREIYEIVHRPILECRVKLKDFRQPSKKKSTLFYPY